MQAVRSPQNQNSTSAVQQGVNSPQERQLNSPFPSAIEVNFPGRLIEGYEAIQRRQETRDKCKSWLEVGTFIGVLATIGINWFILSEMNKTTEANIRSADASAAATTAWVTLDKATFIGVNKANRGL